jgi:hypothetical protein
MSVLELVLKLTNTSPKITTVKFAPMDSFTMMEPLPKDVLLTLTKEKDLTNTLGMKNPLSLTMYLKTKLMILKKWLSLFGLNSLILTPPPLTLLLGLLTMLESEDSLLMLDKLLLI